MEQITEEQTNTTTAENIGILNDGGETNVHAEDDVIFGEANKAEASQSQSQNFNININNASSKDSEDSNEEDSYGKVCPDCQVELVDNNKASEEICPKCKEIYPKDNYIEAKKNPDLSDEDYIAFKNKLFMCEASLIVKDSKAQKYCNEALKIDCRSADVWAYKAKCYFSEKSKNKIISEGYKGVLPIIKFLDVARQADKKSEKLNSVSKEIADNLFNTVKYRFDKVSPIKNRKTGNLIWKLEDFRKIKSYLNIWIHCFKIYKDTSYLKAVINELSGYYGRCWIDYNIKEFDRLGEKELDFLSKDASGEQRLNTELEIVTLDTVKEYQATEFFKQIDYLEKQVNLIEKNKYKRPALIYGGYELGINYLRNKQKSRAIGHGILNKEIDSQNKLRHWQLTEEVINKRHEAVIKDEIELGKMLINEENERKGNIVGIVMALGRNADKVQRIETVENKKKVYEKTITEGLKEYTNSKRTIQFAVLTGIILLIIFIILTQSIR